MDSLVGCMFLPHYIVVVLLVHHRGLSNQKNAWDTVDSQTLFLKKINESMYGTE